MTGEMRVCESPWSDQGMKENWESRPPAWLSSSFHGWTINLFHSRGWIEASMNLSNHFYLKAMRSMFGEFVNHWARCQGRSSPELRRVRDPWMATELLYSAFQTRRHYADAGLPHREGCGLWRNMWEWHGTKTSLRVPSLRFRFRFEFCICPNAI